MGHDEEWDSGGGAVERKLHSMRESSPRVCLVVTTHDKWEMLDRCLGSIKRQTVRADRCIVVTDGEDVPANVKVKYAWATWLKNETCPGPAGSRNVALGYCGTPLIGILDDDVELEPEWLAEMLRFLDVHPEAAICGSKLLLGSRPGTLCSAGLCMDRTGIVYNRGYGEDAVKYEEEEEVLFVSTAALVMRMEVYERIGVFDAVFFHGLDDSDLCWRARIAGFKIFYVPRAIAVHELSYTVRSIDAVKRRTITIRNTVRSLVKNYETLNILRYLPQYLLIRLCEPWIRYDLKKAAQFCLAEIRACAWNILTLGDCLKLRRIVQEARRVRDRELWHLFEKRSLVGLATLVATGRIRDQINPGIG